MGFKEIALLLTVFVFGAKAGITWYNCDTSAPIQIKEINLKSSYPIQIKPNAKISASGSYYNGYLQATSQSTFKAHVVIKKKIGSGWFSTFIKIPCINKMGSCTLDVPCSKIPGCPGNTGNQNFDREITIPRDFKIPGGVLGSLLGSGTYQLRVDVRDASNKRVGCGGGEGKIKV